MRNSVNAAFHLGALALLYGGIVFYCFLWRLNGEIRWVGVAAATITLTQATAHFFQNRLAGFRLTLFYAGGFAVLTWLLVKQ